MVPRAGRPHPRADRVLAGPQWRAADGRRDHRRGGRRAVHGLRAPEGAGRRRVRAGRQARHQCPLPGQRPVRGPFPDRRRCRYGKARPGRLPGGREGERVTRSPQTAVTAPHGVLIRAMEPADAGQVLAIYQAGLDTGQASFETTAPAWEHFDAAKLPAHRHVAADAGTGQILGWTAAVAVSDRCVYAGVIEHSVYIDPGHRRRGIGAVLLTALIASAEEAGVWTIQSGVFPENTASLRLHEQAGFRVVGNRERIGRHHGRGRDTVLIERRSAVAGTG